MITPFSIEAIDETWFFRVSVPATVIQNRIRDSVTPAIVASVVAVLVVIGLLVPLLPRMTRPIRNSALAVSEHLRGWQRSDLSDGGNNQR
ncbi:MAG: hypothetical protein ACLFPW_11140 [Spirochaetaceae bacterium]